MGIKVTQEAVIPAGKGHRGFIMEARLDERTFDRNKGPEQQVVVTVQPVWRQDDSTKTLAIEVLYSPKLNGLSSLSQLLSRLDLAPKAGSEWEPSTLNLVEVVFDTMLSKDGFVKVDKDSIRKPPQKA